MVDTTATPGGTYVTTTLGAGSDTFIGGTASDTVYAGEKADPQTDIERDSLDTGAGNDTVVSGSAGAADRDVVGLGSGRDHLTLRTTAVASDAVLDGGPDRDTLRLSDAGDGDVGLDMAAATFTSSAGTAAFGSFEAAILRLGAGTFTYRGTDGPDSLDLWTTGTPTLDVATGGGDDTVTLAPATIAAGSRLDAGAGQRPARRGHRDRSAGDRPRRQDLHRRRRHRARDRPRGRLPDGTDRRDDGQLR